MIRPDPQIGLIIRCAYIWQSEALAGANAGKKHRPCVIILDYPATQDRSARAIVCPLTHSEPRGADLGIEVMDEAKAQMGLSARQQWVIASEANLVSWDHPSIVELKAGGWTYGMMVRPLLEEARAKFHAAYGARGAAQTIVTRT